jgi:hypothetical protein
MRARRCRAGTSGRTHPASFLLELDVADLMEESPSGAKNGQFRRPAHRMAACWERSGKRNACCDWNCCRVAFRENSAEIVDHLPEPGEARALVTDESLPMLLQLLQLLQLFLPVSLSALLRRGQYA